MLLYIVRHGDPNYELDCLTEKGKKQAAALAESWGDFKPDVVYASSQGRAVETCMYSCEKWNMKPIIQDWSREDLGAYYFFTKKDDGKNTWGFWHPVYGEQMTSPEVMAMGDLWYEHPYFKDTKFKDGVLLMNEQSDAFLLELGYEHDREKKIYKKVKDTPKNAIIFAHGGFAGSFLSSILGIPYNVFNRTFVHMDTTAVTVVEFPETEGRARLAKYNDTNHKKGLEYKN